LPGGYVYGVVSVVKLPFLRSMCYVICILQLGWNSSSVGFQTVIIMKMMMTCGCRYKRRYFWTERRVWLHSVSFFFLLASTFM